MKERKDTFEMPVIPKVEIPKLREGVTMRDHSGGAGTIRRGSVKRQSEIMREKKKSRQEEREEEKQRQASYFRKVTGKFFTPKIHETSSSHIYIYTVSVTLYVSGLRKAKVPLMVYSCGGFSRCFRIARFYDLEGPPVGVEYERPESERKALNPEL